MSSVKTYDDLFSNKPTKLGEVINSIGQEIIFYEHPIFREDYPILCVCHELKLISSTNYYDIDDILLTYDPVFINGDLVLLKKL